MDSYKQLIVWQKAINLVEEIYTVTANLPKTETYGLTSQMRRAAVSIPSNIAESQKRKDLPEYLQFLRISDGSAAELETQLIISKRLYPTLNYLRSESLLEEVQKMLRVLIRRLNDKNLKPKTSNLKPRSGQSILEIVIAMAILVGAISTVIVVVFGNQSISVDAQNAQEATNRARRVVEEARAAARQDFASLQTSSTTANGFTESILVEEIDQYTKKATVRVEWEADPLRTEKIELVTILTDWKIAQQESGGLSGDWTKPQTLGTINLGPGVAGQDIEVLNATIFIAGLASDKKKKDFFVINVAIPNTPTVTTSIDTGPGLVALSLAGTYVYAANTDKNAQLQIIDISNESAPSVVSSTGLQGNTEEGRSVFVGGSYAYIGTEESSGNELQIFNVSDPFNPSSVWTGEIGADVNDIYVSGTHMYVATSRDDMEFMIFDVSNPQSAQQVGSFDAGADGLSIFVANNMAHLGTNSGLLTLDIANLNTITQLGSFATGGAVNDIYVRDYIAFLATANTNLEFQAVNISDPGNLILHSSFNFSQIATGVTYKDNVVYMSVRSNDSLHIITSTP